MKEVGTLKELGVKVGDVVIGGVDNRSKCKILDNCKILIQYENGLEQELDRGWFWDHCKDWRIVSRAFDTPKLWRDMTPEEKGALLLAAHEGKVIEVFEDDCGEWRTVRPEWIYYRAYRIKPEPKVETVTLYGSPDKHIQWCLDQCGLDTHRITFNLIDGKPDCASIKMECIA